MPSNLEIIKLKDLRLSARLISQQLRQGIHSGVRVGIGSEFEQYRHYQPGDDPSRIDWKYFSRSGKYMIKESTTESNLQIRLMLDLSGSMNYSENGFSRLEYAKNLLASLAYLGFLQGDALSFYTLEEGKIEQKVSPSAKSFQRILGILENAEAKGSWPMQPISSPFFQSRDRELVIWVSDFLQKDSEWESLIQQFQHPRKELLLIQILGQHELEFNLDGALVFKDLESTLEIMQNGRGMRLEFQRKFKSYLDQLDRTFQGKNVHLIRTAMIEPLAAVIRKILTFKNLV